MEAIHDENKGARIHRLHEEAYLGKNRVKEGNIQNPGIAPGKTVESHAAKHATADEISNEDKMLCGAAYAIGIPALYIILTEKRKAKFTGFHGTQALFLWIGIVISWIVLRVFLDLIWNIVYLPFLGSLVSLAFSSAIVSDAPLFCSDIFSIVPPFLFSLH